MLSPDLFLLMVPALLLLGYWLYVLFKRYLSRGGRQRIGPRGLLWLSAFIALLVVSARMIQG